MKINGRECKYIGTSGKRGLIVEYEDGSRAIVFRKQIKSQVIKNYKPTDTIPVDIMDAASRILNSK